MEKAEWLPLCNALDKSDRKKFDEMFDIPILDSTSQPARITSVCEVLPYTKAYNVSLLQQLSECIAQVEQIEDKVEPFYYNNKR